MRVSLLGVALWIAALGPGAGSAFAQGFPARAIRIIVPYAPGGVNDIAARLLGRKLGELEGWQLVIENRPGGGGVVGVEAVIHAVPDGYTLLIGSVSEFAITPHLYRTPPYRTLEALTPVALVSDTPLLFAAAAGAPFSTLGELIAYARSVPGGLPFASPGNGTLNHLTGERFALQTQSHLVHVPYKGGGPAGAALAAGEVGLGILAVSSVVPHVKSGRVKAIALTTARRIALYPDWPTVAEAGLPGFEASNWVGLAGPRGLDPRLAALLSQAVRRALEAPDIGARLAEVGSMPLASDPQALELRIRAESERYEKLIAQLQMHID